MKLELKHIAPYVPHGVKGVFMLSDLMDIHPFMDEKRIKELTADNASFFLAHCKMILRPLSDLTKEIEHNGERFIPIMRIFGGDTYDHDYKYEISIVEKPIVGKRIEISVKGLGSPVVSFSVSNILNNPLSYSQWKELLEWHFDIYELIERGLAIDFNTLNEELK